jgi:glycosyltransferase involved in cell wall biosynthesis
MGEGLVVYHVADEISEFTSSHERITRELEGRVLKKVDVVFAASEQLASQKRDWQAPSYGIWNAIDTGAFDHVPPKGSLDDVDRIPGPRVVFVGVIEDWVDLEVLASAATELSHVSFLVVGFARVDSRAIRGMPNVHFLGRRDRLLVPDILRRCSASLIPFKKTKLTARVVPLKLFEALAAGITPVCTDFSVDLHRLAEAGYVKVALTAHDFASAVRQAISEDTPARRRWLSEYGRQQTWQSRWHQIRGIIDRLPAR